MIPESEIPKCREFEVKSKIGKIFKNHNPFDEYAVRIYEIDTYFYEHYEKKNKLIKMGANIFYLEKTQKAIEKSLVLYLLELIQVMQKMAMI